MHQLQWRAIGRRSVQKNKILFSLSIMAVLVFYLLRSKKIKFKKSSKVHWRILYNTKVCRAYYKKCNIN